MYVEVFILIVIMVTVLGEDTVVVVGERNILRDKGSS